MKKGKNGQQIAGENVAAVNVWIAERNQRRDWQVYAYNSRINRSVLAVDLNFAKSVCTQNSTVRALLDAADALWFKNEGVYRAAQEAARERSQVQSIRVSSDNSDLQTRIAELEAENRHLRRDLSAFRKLQALLEGGASGFRV